MHYLLGFFFWLSCIGAAANAQSLGEPTSIRHFYGRSWQRQQLWGERGLGKYSLLQALPEQWYTEFCYQPRQEPPWGAFGITDLDLRALPDNSFELGVQAAATGAWNANLLARLSLQQVNTSLRINGYGLSTKQDRNNDGYLDQPLQRRLLLDNTWAVYLKRFTSLNTIRWLTWNRQGGALDYNPTHDYGTTRAYGNGQQGTHLVYQSDNYISTKDDNGWQLQWRLSDHSERHYYGLRQYAANEWQTRAKAIYQYRLPNEFNSFTAGLFYQYHNVRENVDSLTVQRQEGFGGGFVGYESRLHERLQLSTRLHVGYHNLAHWQVLPYAKLSLYLPKNWKIHLLGGSGIRYANPINEHQHLLESQRQIQITTPLHAERAWYYGTAIQYHTWIDTKQQWTLSLDGHIYFTWYDNKVVADADSDPYRLSFYNSPQTAQEVSLFVQQRWTYLRTGLELQFHYRFDGWFTPIGYRLRQSAYYAPHQWMVGMRSPLIFGGYRYAHIRVQTTVQAGRRIPDLHAKAQAAGHSELPPLQAPAIFRLDFRLSLDGSTLWFQRWKLNRLTTFVGIDNLLNAKQPIAPIGGNQPFEPFFDASLDGLSFYGRRVYLGLSYRFI